MSLVWLLPLLHWYQKEKRDLPWRHTRDPYHIWLSEIMLQQTRVESVKGYYARFLDTFPNVQALAHASEQEVLKLWEGLGYYRRARQLHQAAKIIVEKDQGNFPKTYEEWLTLPGIGSYTAAAIVSNCFDVPVASVDGNVLRVMSRVLASTLNISKMSTAKTYKQMIEKEMPFPPGETNQALMELGAVICTPKSPSCEKCPIAKYCQSLKQGNPLMYPFKDEKKEQKREEKTILFLAYQDQIWLYKKDTGLLSGLYHPYCIEDWLDIIALEEYCEDQHWSGKLKYLGQYAHVFTHRIWDMKAYLFLCKEKPTISSGEWMCISHIYEKIPLPTAYQSFYRVLKNHF